MTTEQTPSQGLLGVHSDAAVAGNLRSKGFGSAQQIAAMPEGEFVAQHADATGGDPEAAREVHRNATQIAARTMHLWATLNTTVASPYFRAMRTSNVGSDVISFFESLPSYQEIFGSLDYCACDECKSIFGPAAYFVDLMRVVDRYITAPKKGTIPTGLTLDERRPDLAQIALTCENTTTQIPYLRVVNEVLSRRVQKDLAVSDAYQSVAAATYPFVLPFHLPLTQVRASVAQLGTDLPTVLTGFGAAETAVTRESLRLSREEHDLITTATQDAKALSDHYGLDLTQPNLGGLIDFTNFLNQTGLTLDQATELFSQNLQPVEVQAPANLSQRFFINRGLNGTALAITPGESGSGGEVISNLNLETLDRIHRFVRLAHKLDWSFTDLDWVLQTTASDPSLPINAPAIATLSKVQRLVTTTRLPLVVLTAFWHDLKTTGLGHGEHSEALFDTVFNSPTLLDGAAPYRPRNPDGSTPNPLYTTVPFPWTVGANTDDTMTYLGRLAAGVGTSTADLTTLATALFGPGATVALTVANISTLYRHITLAKLLGLPVRSYLVLLQTLGKTQTTVFSIDDVLGILDVVNWLKQVGLSVYELDYLLHGTESAYVNKGYRDDQVQLFLRQLWTLIKTAEDGETALLEQLATFFATTTEMVQALAPLVAGTLTPPTAGASYTDVFLTPFPLDAPSASMTYIQGFLAATARGLFLARKLGLSATHIQSIQTHPAQYGIADLQALTLENLRDLATFAALVTAFGDTTGGLVAYMDLAAQSVPAGDAAAQSAATAAKVAALQQVTGWDQQPLAATYVSSGADSPTANQVTCLALLRQRFDLAQRTGLDLPALQRLTVVADLSLADTTAWTQYQTTATSLLAAVKAQHTSADWPSALNTLSQPIEEQARDALCGLTLWKVGQTFPDITTAPSLYEFLLIDVEMSGVTQTSYIAQAISSVQLYMQRCRLNLERGADTTNIPEVWWEWLTNYRIWEANRRIFLYPENYLDPTLRTSKTSLFKDLENELLQADVTDAAVEAAFKKYIDAFDNLAKLSYVDAYHCIVNTQQRGPVDTLFLFARTETEPYTYYYATYETATGVWTEWKKIGLSIGSAYLTPVYAFSRLFIFWVEMKKTTNSKIETANNNAQTTTNSTYTVSLKYSFYNVRGEWVQPQSLGDDFVVRFTPDQYATSVSADGSTGPLRDVFDMSSLYWQKVYPLRVELPQTPSGLQQAADAEKIVVLYGPLLNVELAASRLQMPDRPVDAGDGSPQYEFELTTYHSTDRFNRVLDARSAGYLPHIRAIILNRDLEEDFILRKSEFIVLHKDAPDANLPMYRPEIDRINSVVSIVRADSTLHSNYLGDYTPPISAVTPPSVVTANAFVGDGITAQGAQQIFNDLQANHVIDQTNRVEPYFTSQSDLSFLFGGAPDDEKAKLTAQVRAALFQLLGDPVLLANIAERNSTTIAVKNQPGWFIFDNGDECFLIKPSATTFDPITSKTAASPAISTYLSDSFIMPGINRQGSQQVFNDLTANHVLDPAGRLDPYFSAASDLSFLFAGAPDDEKTRLTREVRDLLLNLPVVQAYQFICPDINEQGATQVYNDLQANNIVDANGRLEAYFTRDSDLSFLFGGEPDAKRKQQLTKQVQNVLLNLPVVTTLNYKGSVGGVQVQEPHDLKFDVVRLSTGAIHKLSRELFAGGIDRLLALESQQAPILPQMPFNRLGPGPQIIPPTAMDGAQVDFVGPYGLYFWELFFHAPVLIATRLQSNQQFRDAQKWFQYVFNPTAPEAPVQPQSFITPDIDQAMAQQVYQALQTNHVLDAHGNVDPKYTPLTPLDFLFVTETNADRRARLLWEVRAVLFNHQLATPASRYWQFQPFRNHSVESLLDGLSDSRAITMYNLNPFDPHAIAGLRIGAYEKSVVMQYITNLLDWGDSLFAQDTSEAINQATMYYVYAYDLLGPRPTELGPAPASAPATFADIQKAYQNNPGGIPQFLIDLENLVAAAPTVPTPMIMGQPINEVNGYFCVPENDQLIAYWDRVEDRLFKIRHSMNLQGQVRQLALFAPPINPMDLVRAAAAGANVLEVVAPGQAAVPAYRFPYLLDRAKNITSTVIQLGGALLSALEKRDAEALSLLRTTHEGTILNLMTLMKQKQIDELQASLDGLNASLSIAKARNDYYTKLINDGLSSYENTSLTAMDVALGFNIGAQIMKTAAAIGYAVPQVGSPFAMTYGGQQIGASITAAGGALELGSAISTYISQRSATMAGYARRGQEWRLQQQVAQYEITQMQQQIAASQARLDSATRDLVVHQRNIVQNQAIEDFLKTKFTNRDLYEWMIARSSAIYFQTYKLALDMAKAAQRAYQYELGVDDAFITVNYWDSLRKGLLAGEGLMFALNSLEQAYIQNNTRRYEIEKHVSLLQLNPEQFLALRATGKCTFSLTEALFDADFPGHYRRQIKSVSLSIPAIVGPYQNIKATLIQTGSKLVMDPNIEAVRFLLKPPTGNGPVSPPSGVVELRTINQHIALSKGVDDAGMFMLDFRDERYLPFEGTGAVSDWELRLPKLTNRIDFTSLSDVILHIKYTSLTGGDAFEQAVATEIANAGYEGAKYLDLKQFSPSGWFNLMQDRSNANAQRLTFSVPANSVFPNLLAVTLAAVWLRVDVGPDVTLPRSADFLTLEIGGATQTLQAVSAGIWQAENLSLPQTQFLDAPWVLTVDLTKARQASANLIKDGFLDPDQFTNVELILTYTATLPS